MRFRKSRLTSSIRINGRRYVRATRIPELLTSEETNLIISLLDEKINILELALAEHAKAHNTSSDWSDYNLLLDLKALRETL